jgi:hypothetical protein
VGLTGVGRVLALLPAFSGPRTCRVCGGLTAPRVHCPQGLMFNAVVYVSGYLFLLFVAVCLGAPRPLRTLLPSLSHAVRFGVLRPACGLYYLAELVEEYTTLTKRLMYVFTYTVLVAHPLFYIFEQLPLDALVCGAVAHGCERRHRHHLCARPRALTGARSMRAVGARVPTRAGSLAPLHPSALLR